MSVNRSEPSINEPPYDLVVLGSGTTAFAAARRASGMGRRVLMLEHSQLGGTCVNWGCIPSKTLVDKAEHYFSARRGQPWGLNLSAAFPDCPRLMEVKQRVVETLRREKYQSVLEADPLIDVHRGHGRFLCARQIQVGAEIVDARRILIACGGIPRVPPIPGLSQVRYLTSYSALHLKCFPESLLIVGAGVVALELGQMFARFGTRVTLVERGQRILGDFDPRIAELFQQVLRSEGVELVLNCGVKRAFAEPGGAGLEVEVEGRLRMLRAAQLMVAVGTAPATADIGLEEAGVEVDEGGFVITDKRMRTSAEGIWAAGDVAGPPLVAPAGALEAEVAVDDMFKPEWGRVVDHRHTPMAIFASPELASVGITAGQAVREGLEAEQSWLGLEQVAKAHVMGETRGGILLCAQKGSGRLLGVQILAPRASEVIHEAALALRCGLRVSDLAAAPHVYPSIADGLRLAAMEHLRLHGAQGAVRA